MRLLRPNVHSVISAKRRDSLTRSEEKEKQEMPRIPKPNTHCTQINCSLDSINTETIPTGSCSSSSRAQHTHSVVLHSLPPQSTLFPVWFINSQSWRSWFRNVGSRSLSVTYDCMRRESGRCNFSSSMQAFS